MRWEAEYRFNDVSEHNKILYFMVIYSLSPSNNCLFLLIIVYIFTRKITDLPLCSRGTYLTGQVAAVLKSHFQLVNKLESE